MVTLTVNEYFSIASLVTSVCSVWTPSKWEHSLYLNNPTCVPLHEVAQAVMLFPAGQFFPVAL